jgi:hypothetical protein
MCPAAALTPIDYSPYSVAGFQMPNRIYRVSVTLPDLVAAHAQQVAKVESNNWASAIRLACDEISKRPHVKGKHVSNGRISFLILDKAETDQKKEKTVPTGSDAYQQGDLFEA